MTGAVFLGGSFDPPHLGHLFCANAAAKSLGVDGVIFVPAGRQPLKECMASPQQRLAMVKAMLEGTPHQVGTWELDRQGPSFTVDTLRQVRRLFKGRLVWLIGGDVLASLHRWKDLPGLMELADLVPFQREGHSLELPHEARSLLGPEGSQAFLSRALCVPPRAESSSAIRNALAAGRHPEGLHPAVERLIREQGLYRSALQ
ncbi:MAG: nicotinate (nicotinamide) nucleotide adenylyltransferase [Planctomycetota bacterium]